ncbi:MAG: glycoside hydrolase family 5 protein [Holosporales bacterium]|nr:glycoside hydrolase family 5 protein [Holosporales bacterium]
MPRNPAVFLASFLLLSTGCGDGPRDEVQPSEKIAFWEESQRGTNIFNGQVNREDIRAAKKYNIKFVRLSLDKWPSKRKDFLMGDADHYDQLDSNDLTYLKKVLAMFAEEGMPVVITMLGLPGCRWSQHNGGTYDSRIWQDPQYRKQAVKFWKDLARALRTCPIVVAYDVLNEPRPEDLLSGRISDHPEQHPELQKRAQHPLRAFHEEVVEAIRSVDPNTPILLEASAYADPGAFRYMHSLDAQYILYSFHMYEPYAYTNRKNCGKYLYPGTINGKYWDRAALEAYMRAVVDFQRAYHIPSKRILVGEFGGYRKQSNLPQYLHDLLQIFEGHHWHWAFYAFREDSWDGMDYELGSDGLPWSYWKAVERGETPRVERKDSWPQFTVLKRALEARQKSEKGKREAE